MQIKWPSREGRYRFPMEDRLAQLRRRIAFYRNGLKEGVPAEVARQYLAAIAELETEIARLEQGKGREPG